MSSNFNSKQQGSAQQQGLNPQQSGQGKNQQQQQQTGWNNQQSGQWNQQQGQGQWNQQQGLNTYTSSNQQPMGHVERVVLPTQHVEKPAAIHEEIRKELIEEVQPVVNVEKLKTEVHQVTQPLFDKEVRPVHIENRMLASEYLPEVRVEGRGSRAQSDHSTTKYLDTATVVVEKPAQYNQVERMQVIEEVQPVIYKETIVPTVIQETKPVYQKVVEGPVYTHDTLASRDITNQSNIAPAYQTSREVIAPTRESHRLPTQVVEKPAAVHEEIRRETVEEVTPVWNVEKLKTEVHQITAPLYDKEVKPVQYQQKTLDREILPEVRLDGRGFRATDDISSTKFLDTTSRSVEKPAIYNEVERTQVIEEIQPVIYKETVVPSVIRETKPVYQKIIEGTIYTQETLPPRSLSGSDFSLPQQSSQFENAPRETFNEQQYPEQQFPRESFQLEQQFPREYEQYPMEPVILQQQPLVEKIYIIEEGARAPLSHPTKVFEETTTTTTTTTTAALPSDVGAPAKKHHGLFHRHGKDTANASTGFNQPSTGYGNQQRGTGLPGETHTHNERLGPNGQKIIEDTTTTRSHTEQVLPTRPF